jgi:hypothetical protein
MGVSFRWKQELPDWVPKLELGNQRVCRLAVFEN